MNPILLASFVAWVLAQGGKALFAQIRQRKVDLNAFIRPGGMPSTHSALVSAMAAATGLREGFDSSLFGVSVVVAFVVMYDATGVRQAVGRQAKLINSIVDDLKRYRRLPLDRAKEVLGHTFNEVIVGSLIGVLTAWYLVG